MIHPIAFETPESVNQRFPSGPVVIEPSELVAGRPFENSLIVPAVVIRQIASVEPLSSNHKLPSAPEVIATGALSEFNPVENVVIVGVIAPAGAWSAIATAATRTAATPAIAAVRAVGQLR